jgi:hypothetical protein
MRKIEYDSSRTGTYELIPEGWYEVVVDRSREDTVGKQKNIPRISFGLKIQAGEYEGRIIWSNILLSPPRTNDDGSTSQPSLLNLRWLLHSCDPNRFISPKEQAKLGSSVLEIPDLPWFEGKRVFAKAKHRSFIDRKTQKERTVCDVDWFRSLDDGPGDGAERASGQGGATQGENAQSAQGAAGAGAAPSGGYAGSGADSDEDEFLDF